MPASITNYQLPITSYQFSVFNYQIVQDYQMETGNWKLKISGQRERSSV